MAFGASASKDLQSDSLKLWLSSFFTSAGVNFHDTELQITFQCNAYLPPNFLINADFQN